MSNEQNCYGDVTVFEGVRSEDSIVPTLQLAIDLEGPHGIVTCQQAAAELRRLHEVNQELYEALDRLMNGTTDLQDAMDANKQAKAALAKARGEI